MKCSATLLCLQRHLISSVTIFFLEHCMTLKINVVLQFSLSIVSQATVPQEFKLIKVRHWYGPFRLQASYSCPSLVLVPSINWLHKESNSRQLWTRSKVTRGRTKQNRKRLSDSLIPWAAPWQNLMNATASVMEGKEMQSPELERRRTNRTKTSKNHCAAAVPL